MRTKLFSLFLIIIVSVFHEQVYSVGAYLISQINKYSFYDNNYLAGVKASTTINKNPPQEIKEGNDHLLITTNVDLQESGKETYVEADCMQVIITQPGEGEIFNAPTDITVSAEISGNADGHYKIAFFKGDDRLGEDNDPPYSITWSDAPPGSYKLTAVAYQNTRTIVSNPIEISLQDQQGSLILIDAATNQDIHFLSNGDTINLAQTGHQLNIRAEYKYYKPESVVFGLNEEDKYYTDEIAPFSLAGDDNGKYKKWFPYTGNYKLTAAAYDLPDGSGDPGPLLAISFTIINEKVEDNMDVSGILELNKGLTINSSVTDLQ